MALGTAVPSRQGYALYATAVYAFNGRIPFPFQISRFSFLLEGEYSGYTAGRKSEIFFIFGWDLTGK